MYMDPTSVSEQLWIEELLIYLNKETDVTDLFNELFHYGYA